MIVLDTNVLSEVLKPVSDDNVLDWLRTQPPASLFTTTITRAELLYGIRIMADGHRKDRLLELLEQLLTSTFSGRVLGFDPAAADAFADIAVRRRAAGRPISQFDAMIAAITASRGARLATRNTKDFVGCGIDLVDPWRDSRE